MKVKSKNMSCNHCGDTATRQCSGCKKTLYCGRSCQVADWKDKHQLICKETVVPVHKTGPIFQTTKQQPWEFIEKYPNALKDAAKTEMKDIEDAMKRVLMTGKHDFFTTTLYAKHLQRHARATKQHEIVQEFVDEAFAHMGIEKSDRNILREMWKELEKGYTDIVRQFTETGDKAVLLELEKTNVLAKTYEAMLISKAENRPVIDVVTEMDKLKPRDYAIECFEQGLNNLGVIPGERPSKQKELTYLERCAKRGSFFGGKKSFQFVGANGGETDDENNWSDDEEYVPQSGSEDEVDETGSLDAEEYPIYNRLLGQDPGFQDVNRPLWGDENGRLRGDESFPLAELRAIESAVYNKYEEIEATGIMGYVTRITSVRYATYGLGGILAVVYVGMSLYLLKEGLNILPNMMNKKFTEVNEKLVEINQRTLETEEKAMDLLKTLRETRDALVPIPTSIYENPSALNETISQLFVQLYHVSDESADPRTKLFVCRKFYEHQIGVLTELAATTGGASAIALRDTLKTLLDNLNNLPTVKEQMKQAEEYISTMVAMFTGGSKNSAFTPLEQAKMTEHMVSYAAHMSTVMTKTLENLGAMEEHAEAIAKLQLGGSKLTREAYDAVNSPIVQVPVKDLDTGSIMRSFLLDLNNQKMPHPILREAGRVGIETLSSGLIATSRSLKAFTDSPEFQNLVMSVGREGAIAAIHWPNLLVTLGVTLLFNDWQLKIVYAAMTWLTSWPKQWTKQRFSAMLKHVSSFDTFSAIEYEQSIGDYSRVLNQMDKAIRDNEKSFPGNEENKRLRSYTLHLRKWEILSKSTEIQHGMWSFMFSNGAAVGCFMACTGILWEFNDVLIASSSYMTNVAIRLGLPVVKTGGKFAIDLFSETGFSNYALFLGPAAVFATGKLIKLAFERHYKVSFQKHSMYRIAKIIGWEQNPSSHRKEIISRQPRPRLSKEFTISTARKLHYHMMKNLQWVMLFLMLTYQLGYLGKVPTLFWSSQQKIASKAFNDSKNINRK